MYFFSQGVQTTASLYKGMLLESSFPTWKAPLGASSHLCILNLPNHLKGSLWHEEEFFEWFYLFYQCFYATNEDCFTGVSEFCNNAVHILVVVVCISKTQWSETYRTQN